MQQAGSENGIQRPISVVGAVLKLTAVLLAVLVGVAYWSFEREGLAGVLASCIAAGVCWAAAVTAVVITARYCNTPHALSAVLGSMLIRTGIPMAAAIVISGSSPSLAAVGVFGKFVIFFLVALAVETWLSVAIVNASTVAARSSDATTIAG